MSFLWQVIVHTPAWVWLLFVLLLWLGWSGLRSRVVPVWRPALLPLIGVGVSLTGLVQSSQPALAVASWLAILLLALVPGYLLGRRRPARRQPDGTLEIPGSWFTLVFSLSVFLARYALGVLFGMAPALRSEPLWVALSAGVGGAVAGVGLGWLVAVLARARRVDSTPRGVSLAHLLLVGALAITGLSLSPREAVADEAGWRRFTVPGTADAEAIPVALYYPTQAPSQAVTMGLFTANVAIGASPSQTVRGLIVLSHGTGGSEVGHSSLAEALARRGYLVAALPHPGDNWQDRSLWSKAPDRYFIERPAQVSRVIDALLADPDWKDRIATDAQGPRIGAVGHSAGGYTVTALAGGQADLRRIGEHCRDDAAQDPIFCSMVRPSGPATPPPSIPPTVDTRMRAVVAMAPFGVAFTASSLANIRIPLLVYAAERDRWLVPRFHADWIARNVPNAEFQSVANAWHFAFLDPPSGPIPTIDGDAAADPPGFDRRAFLARLQAEIPAFFDTAFTARP